MPISETSAVPLFSSKKHKSSGMLEESISLMKTTPQSATPQSTTATSTPFPGTPFDFKRGDLIYGLSDNRAELYQKLYLSQTSGSQKMPKEVDNVTFINHAMSRLVDTVTHEAREHLEVDADYNSESESDTDGNEAAAGKKPGLAANQVAQTLLTDSEISDAFRQTYRSISQEEDLTDFLCETASSRAGDAHKNLIRILYEMSAFSSRRDRRYDIPQLQFREETESLRHEKATGQPALPGDAKGTFSARVSKMGILAAALPGTTHHIHFALDEVDMEAVVRKSGPNGNSNTACELRAAHRLGEAVSGRIHFYKGGQPCPPPWDSQQGLWSEREPKRKMNFSGLLPPGLHKSA